MPQQFGGGKMTPTQLREAFSTVETVVLPTFNIFDEEHKEKARVAWERDGVVALSIHKTDTEKQHFCEHMVRNAWNSTMESNGFTKEVMENVPMINSPQDLVKFMSPMSNEFKESLQKGLGRTWFPHFGFGAPAFFGSFHLPEQWYLRTHVELADFVKTLSGGHVMYPSIDRCFIKGPGKGMMQGVHVDTNIFATDEDKGVNIQGKYMATKGCFMAALGSHKWTAQVVQQYKEHYPGVKGAKFGLNAEKPDPMGICAAIRKIPLDPGTLVLWNENTFHQVYPQQTGGAGQDQIGFGVYQGFHSNINRDSYKTHSGVNELEDRFNMYNTGHAPHGYPSGDPVRLIPRNHMIYTCNITRLTDRMDKASPVFDFSMRRLAREDRMVPHLVQKHPVLKAGTRYEPYPLTLRGKQMLVGRENVRRFFGHDDNGKGSADKDESSAKDRAVGSSRN
jgi:hypothetical protein